MPGELRIECSGAFYHEMNRVDRRERIIQRAFWTNRTDTSMAELVLRCFHWN